MSKKIVCIDAGHGGHDPGAVGNGLKEKDLTLTISKLIRDMLLSEYENVEVKMTRETDVFHELTARTNMANTWNADFFLSVHINAGGGTGFESFIYTSPSTKSVSAQSIIHSEVYKKMGGVTDRGNKRANFAVVRQTKMPSILTEILFIDNPNDAKLLHNTNYLLEVARGHVNGLVKVLDLKKKSIPTDAQKKIDTVKFIATPTTIYDEKNNTSYEGFVKSGVTYAPVRSIAESSGRKVKWDRKSVTLE